MEAASLTAPAGRTLTRGPWGLRVRTDDQLVALFRLGDDDAFRVIHDRYRPRLLIYAQQMLPGSRADAEDALQDVFLRAYGALRADGRPVTLRAWLYRVAHNRCIDHRRRPANQPTDELPEQVCGRGDPLARVERREDLRRLVEDVRRLPGPQRSALLMRELEGLSYVELSVALGVSVPAVKSLLVRARIGLTEARDARATACVDIRGDLLIAHDRGVRATGRARRHLRECADCAAYRTRLRSVREGLAAVGAGPTGWGAVAKLLGLGGAGGGAAAAAGGGGGAIAGGVLTIGGTAKVAALVCSAAVVGGGAVGATRELRDPAPDRPAAARVAPDAPAAARAAPTPPAGGLRPATVVRPRAGDERGRVAQRPGGATAAPPASAAVTTAAPPVAPDAVVDDEPASLGGPSAHPDALQTATAGGALAPEEPAAPEPPLPGTLFPDPPIAEPGAPPEPADTDLLQAAPAPDAG